MSGIGNTARFVQMDDEHADADAMTLLVERPVQSTISPLTSAAATVAVLFLVPSLRCASSKCQRTFRSESARMRPVSQAVLPRAAQRSTSASISERQRDPAPAG